MAVLRVALLCALVAVPHFAKAQSAARGSGSKVLTGKICTKSDSACVRCVKSTSGGGKKGHSLDCLACSTGPVNAELEEGRCVCPAGSALTGSRLTVKVAGGGGGGGKRSSSSRSGGGKSGGPATCSECDVNSYAPLSKPVSASRCIKCPTGTTTRGETGSSTCYVEPGQFFDPSKPDGQQVITCPVDQYCPGGDISAEGLLHPDCPAGSTTLGTTGNDVIGDCIVPPGSYYDGKNVVKCPGESFGFIWHYYSASRIAAHSTSSHTPSKHQQSAPTAWAAPSAVPVISRPSARPVRPLSPRARAPSPSASCPPAPTTTARMS
jgi:hypothetical protein